MSNMTTHLRNGTAIPLTASYDEAWTIATPAAYGTEQDSVLIIEADTICRACGQLATQRMSYVWEGTTDERLRSLGLGSSVKHFFTECHWCGELAVS